MKRIINHIIALAGLPALMTLTGCNGDDINGDSYYTFTGETVASYCESRPSMFSVFSQIIKDSGEESLFSTYGHYTCFIPTDSAFNAYFAETGKTLATMTAQEKQAIVFNHAIRSLTLSYMTKDFTEGALGTANMNNRYMVMSYQPNDNGSNDIMVNKSAKITLPDVELHNGVVHVINRVIVPSDETLGSVLQTLPKFTIFSKAFDLTHLNDSISESYDMSYNAPYTTEFVTILGYKMKTIAQKKLGCTIFAEPDSVLKAANINSVDDLIKYAEAHYGTSDQGNYTSRQNALNKFISYHILNRQMSTNSFVYNGPCTAPVYMDKRYEYYETMLQYRLMEIKAGNKINTLSNGDCVTLNTPESNISGANGYIHCLNDILVYDENNMQQDVLNKRIRFDAYSIPPELTNNNVRWQLTGLDGYGYTITPDFCGDYFKFNEASKFIMWASNDWTNYQADEMSIRGWYDFTVRMLPVPPGTYEIRLGYSVREWGGLAQIFIDEKITGIPVDFQTKASNPKIGWVDDDQTTDSGDENDKMMHNRGYMKGPASAYKPNYKQTLRQADGAMRKVIGTFTFQDYAPHYFRAKNVESELGEFHFDYLEYVPVSYIDKEDKD